MIKLFAPIALATSAFLFGCAHPISITPDLTRISQSDVKPVDVNVGYYISPADLAKEVTTPGGGGDMVRYSPYKELEPALFKVLSTMFRRVYPMPSVSDKAIIQANNITFVFVPQIATNSSSDGAFTWPPTWFQVKLSCQALDSNGKVIWTRQIVGEGKATYGEFKTDFPLAAKRASEQAINNLQHEVNDAPEFRK